MTDVDVEQRAYAWLDEKFGSPEDQDYSADQMIDAYMEGAAHRLAALSSAPVVETSGFAAGIEGHILKFATNLEDADFSNVSGALNDRMCCNGVDCGCQGSTVGQYLAHELRDVLAAALKPVAGGTLPADVTALVIAAREVWERDNQSGDEEMHALDRALEAFSSRVPYENEPGSVAPHPRHTTSVVDHETGSGDIQAPASEVERMISRLIDVAYSTHEIVIKRAPELAKAFTGLFIAINDVRSALTKANEILSTITPPADLRGALERELNELLVLIETADKHGAGRAIAEQAAHVRTALARYADREVG